MKLRFSTILNFLLFTKLRLIFLSNFFIGFKLERFQIFFIIFFIFHKLNKLLYTSYAGALSSVTWLRSGANYTMYGVWKKLQQSKTL